MAFLTVQNVSIKGIAAAVPKGVKEIRECEFFAPGEAEKVISLTKVERSRIVREGQCCSDLCYEAAEKLIADLGWSKQEIDGLIFICLGRDYIAPATSAVLQHRLGLNSECYCIDVPLACSGYVYGLSLAGSLISANGLKKVLLLVGEATSLMQSKLDKVLYPLHGDGGSATALEYDTSAEDMYFHLCTDGSRFDSIIHTDGGKRNPLTPDSLELREYEPGVIRNRVDATMNGLSVFSFSIKEPPKNIIELCDHYTINLNSIDYLLLHQANKYMDDKIAKKLKVPMDKVPFSLMEFGNTSSTTIPLTTVVCLKDELKGSSKHVIMCGFGAGLSWASCYVNFRNVLCSDLVEVE